MKNLLLLVSLFALFSCGNQQSPKEEQKQEKLVVTSVNYPLYYFAQRIGGDLIQNKYPIPADVDPAYWVPDEKTLEIYQSADIILANGANYAKWMNNVSLPSSRIVNTSKAVEKSYIELNEVATHSHGPEGEHEHTGYAFTTWLNFEMAAAQAEAIKNALTTKRSQYKDAFASNYDTLSSELKKLDESMTLVAKKFKEQTLFVSHPVYQYLSQAYGLDIVSVHWEPGDMPTDGQWKEFKQKLEQHPSELMLWEEEPLEEVKEMLSEMGIRIVVFNPCGNHPEISDFIKRMRKNINSLQDIL